jgi:cation transport regulator ChaB
MAASVSVQIDLGSQDPAMDTSTAMVKTVLPKRRRISLAQARENALAILSEAEKRRADFAEEEARRSAVWESQG